MLSVVELCPADHNARVADAAAGRATYNVEYPWDTSTAAASEDDVLSSACDDAAVNVNPTRPVGEVVPRTGLLPPAATGTSEPMRGVMSDTLPDPSYVAPYAAS